MHPAIRDRVYHAYPFLLQMVRIASHADPRITLKVYSHLLADGLADAARLYDPLGPSEGVSVASVGLPLSS